MLIATKEDILEYEKEAILYPQKMYSMPTVHKHIFKHSRQLLEKICKENNTPLYKYKGGGIRYIKGEDLLGLLQMEAETL